MPQRISPHHAPAASSAANSSAQAAFPPGGMPQLQTQVQQRFAHQRLQALQQYGHNTPHYRQAVAQARQEYKARMEVLRRHYQMPLRAVPLQLDYSAEDMTPAEFSVLNRCAHQIAAEVWQGFDEVTIHNDDELEDGGGSFIHHPCFDDTYSGRPHTEEEALVSISAHAPLSNKIATLVHELSCHAIPNMKKAVTGEAQESEEQGHFSNLSARSAFHRSMVALEQGWSAIQSTAARAGLAVSLNDVRDEFLSDIGLQTTTLIEHLGLDVDQIDALTERCRARQVDPRTLPQNVQMALSANIYCDKLRRACIAGLPLSSVR